MGPNRIAYLDLVKLFTIYLVILGHVIIMMNPDLSVGGRLYTFIYTFHMPLFVMISGYFCGSSLSKPFLSFVKVKARQLLLPVLSCTVIACVYLFLFRDTANYRDEMIGNSWFLKVLFVYYLLVWLLKKTGFNEWVLFMISCVILFFIPRGSSLQLNLLFPYFWVGYSLKKYHILETMAVSSRYFVFFLLLFAGLYVVQTEAHIPTYIPINIETLGGMWRFILFRYMIGSCGCLFVILGIAYLNKKFKPCSLVNKVAKYGQMTLGVYVLQTILVINIFPDVVQWNIESEWMFNVIVAPVIALVFLVLCLWLILVLSKCKVLDLLLFGGQYYKVH